MPPHTVQPPFDQFLTVADVIARERPEVELHLAREVFQEVATTLYNGLALDGLDDHDTRAAVAALCDALVSPDPGAAIRARAEETLVTREICTIRKPSRRPISSPPGSCSCRPVSPEFPAEFAEFIARAQLRRLLEHAVDDGIETVDADPRLLERRRHAQTGQQCSQAGRQRRVSDRPSESLGQLALPVVRRFRVLAQRHGEGDARADPVSQFVRRTKSVAGSGGEPGSDYRSGESGEGELRHPYRGEHVLAFGGPAGAERQGQQLTQRREG